jgi:hypothetical protein
VKATDDPTNSWVPLPMVMALELPPTPFVVSLVLNVLTSRKTDNTPGPSSAPVSRVQQMVGNHAGQRRGGVLQPMRKNELLAVVRGLQMDGWLLKFAVKDGRLHWTWPNRTTDPHNIRTALGGFGGHCMFPKAVAYDPRIPGVDKKTYAGVHYMRYIRSDNHEALPWQQTLYQGTENLGGYIGLERHSVARSLLSLEDRGLLEVEMRPRALTRIRIMPINASYICIRTTSRRDEWPLWVPIETLWSDGGEEKVDRLRRYRLTGDTVGFSDPQHWMADTVGGMLFGTVPMDDELLDTYIEDTTGVALVIEPAPAIEEGEDYEAEQKPEPKHVEPPVTIAFDPAELLLAREFDRRAKALGTGVPASCKRVSGVVREWLRRGSTPDEVTAVMDVFFTGPAHEARGANTRLCGACKAQAGQHCRPTCTSSFAQEFIDQAPALARRVAEAGLLEIRDTA